MIRLFVAIDLPDPVRQRLAAMSCGLPGARWVREEQLHLTLRFIGEVDGAVFRDIRAALDTVACRPFTLQLDGVGFFPPRGRPRVVWSGVAANSKLVHLRNRIESTLVGCGLAPERRRFSPHITLARLNNTPPSRVGRFLEEHNLFLSEPFMVREFVLYSSVLGQKGAKHYPEERYPLSGDTRLN